MDDLPIKKNYSFRINFLIELFNISVRKAASVLSEIVNKKINLRVPELKLINLEENPSEFYDYILNVGSGSILVSSLSINKDIKGIANLIFPANKMRYIISF